MARKPILCLDFDGVLHSYTSGWHGADRVDDPPVPGAIEFLREAVKHFRVAIFSSRSSQPGGFEAMQAWLASLIDPELDSEWFGDIEWPTEKPPAMLTIDDRSLTFDGNWPAIAELLAFQPWNKRGKVPEDLHFSVQPNGSEWWASFIEFWAARGVDRAELNKAVVAFRAAQQSLSKALAA